jgi:hypothetical protein
MRVKRLESVYCNSLPLHACLTLRLATFNMQNCMLVRMQSTLSLSLLSGAMLSDVKSPQSLCHYTWFPVWSIHLLICLFGNDPLVLERC